MADKREIPRLALTKTEAAACLGMCPQTFNKHVAPQVKAVRVGALILYSQAELEAWLEREGNVPLHDALDRAA